MIILTKDEETKFAVTLAEKLPIVYSGSTSAFTFQMKSIFENEIKEYILEDLSENTERYNKFALNYSGQTGFYDYIFFDEDGEYELEKGLVYVKFN